MNKRRLPITFLFICFVSQSVMGQLIRITGSTDTFIPEMKVIMATDNNSFAIAQGNKLEGYWNTQFTPTQKQTLVSMAQEMAKRGHKMPQYYLLLRLLDHCIETDHYSEQELNNLLLVVGKMITANSLKKANDNLEQLNEFVRTHLLYTSNYNKLYALNGSYSFRFIEKPTAYFETAKVLDEQASTSSDELIADFDKPLEDDGWNSITPSKTDIDLLKKEVELPLAADFIIDLKNIDLAIVTVSDSAVIKNTSGGVFMQKGLFVGNEGTFSWASVGLPQIQVKLKKYYFEIRNPRFSAEDVTLSYPERLENPIDGIVEYKGYKRPTGTASTYPRFKSYQATAVFKNIEEGIQYKGGFSMMGSQILSSSLEERYTTITVKDKDKYNFKISSSRFVVSDSLITSDRTSFVAYIGNDSISHPAVKLTYNLNKKTLRLNKLDGGGFKDTPFSDTYHQMDIRCDAVRWDLQQQKIDFYIVSGKGVVPAVFESFNFFNPRRVTDLSSAAGFNPVLLVGNFARKNRKFDFTIDEIARSVGRPPQQLEGGLQFTVQQGLLSYNPMNKVYTLTAKGKHYIQAFAGQKDYDDLIVPSFFNSTDSTSNGSFDLKSMDLTIRGTKEFNLSDSLGISFQPYNDKILLKKNRTFSFDGQLKVKNYRFAGKNLEIDYDNFTVKLNKIDSISFIPQAVYRKGGKREIGSHIKFEQSGFLYLNRPDNKAGKVSLPEYPRLVMEKGVVVYFDESSRKNRRYNREVYFDIPTIDYDSLNVKDLEFEGTFYSGGIFKSFKEKLIVMPDTTIGFTHRVPNDNYSVYGNTTGVKFSANLQMDGKGLHSAGSIHHLAATLSANDIFFATDSLLAKGTTGEIKETDGKTTAYFPQVDIKDYSLKWIPAVDSMIIASKKGFNFYQGTSTLTGKLVVRQGGLFGLGLLARNDSETASEQFKFDKPGFKAEQSVFKIKSAVVNSKPVLLGRNVDVDFNILKNTVAIQINEKDFNDTTQSSLEFPYAAYRTNIGKASWSIEEKKVTMQGDVINTTFTSTNPTQEGLLFNGNLALYDIVGMTLNIDGVPFIKSADAKIIPENGKVVIRRDAEMLPFKNARLTIDTLNGYHNLINGNIRILSKKQFTGDATYQFVNVSKDTFNIKMGNFELRNLTGERRDKRDNEALSTVARANVIVQDSVFLSPKMLYKGDFTMLAPQKNLSLDGYVIPELKKYPELGGSWITYKGDKSEEIVIPVNEKLQSNDNRLYAGLHLRSTVTTNGIYPTFLSPKKSPDDDDFFITTGMFRRDEPNKLFSIYPENTSSNEGNRYELLDNQGIIRTNGSYKLLSGKNQTYIKTSGFGEVLLDSNDYNFDFMLVYDFPVSSQLTTSMADKIIKTNLDLGNVARAMHFESDTFLLKVSQFVGEKEAKSYQNQLYREHLPMFKLSPKFATTMVLSEVKMRWNAETNSFYSVGPLGFSNIGLSDINAKLNGYLEIIKNPVAGDQVNLFVEMSGENWYYFGFKNNEMGIVSSDETFNQLVTAKDKGTRASKDYKVIAVDFAEPIAFRKHFLMTYRGVKEDQFGKKPVNTKKLAETPKPEDKKQPEKKKTEETEGF